MKARTFFSTSGLVVALAATTVPSSFAGASAPVTSVASPLPISRVDHGVWLDEQNHEVALFGVNYAQPFAFGYRALAAKGLTPEMADIVMKPNNEIELAGDDAIKMQKLLDALEALDDVQEVYTNAVMDEQG